MTLYVNEELVSRMSPEQQAEVRAEIARRKKEVEAQEARDAETKRQYELRKHPTSGDNGWRRLEALFKRINAPTVPHIRDAVLKRLHIIIAYLNMPALPSGMEPTLEYSLGLMGRAEMSLKLIEEIGRILQDATGYTFIKVFPREAIELRDHMKERYMLAEELVRAITFQKIKEDGLKAAALGIVRSDPTIEIVIGNEIITSVEGK